MHVVTEGGKRYIRGFPAKSASKSQHAAGNTSDSEVAVGADDADATANPVRPSTSSVRTSRPYQMGGMGMPYGAMGYGAYGGYGMGMYGNPMMGMLMGPMNFIYTINYSIMAIGQVFEMIGASSQGLLQLAHSTLAQLKSLEQRIRQSAFRRWLQKKCKKSKVFRFLLVLVTMALSYHLSRLVQHTLQDQVGRFFGFRSTPMLRSAGESPSVLSTALPPSSSTSSSSTS